MGKAELDAFLTEQRTCRVATASQDGLRVRASPDQAQRLLAWAAAWPERTWAIEGAEGVGHLLAQQLLADDEQVLGVQPKLSARVRLLATGDASKTTQTMPAR